jgi:hypothetical protein
MKLIPLKCPYCGGKLKLTGSSVLISCSFCRGMAEFNGEAVGKIKQSIVAVDDKPDICLPFWLISFDTRATKIEVSVPQSLFHNDGDTTPQYNNQEKPIFPSAMVVVAFRVNNFINYTADLSTEISQRLKEGFIEKQPDKTMEYDRCYYNHVDAQSVVETLLRTMANKKSRNILDIDLDTHWKDYRLLWWPFKKDGDCWRDMLFEQRLLQSALV